MSLGPDARALIEAAGEGDEPSVDDAARVRARVAARLAVAASVGAAAGAATKTAAAGTGATGSVSAGVVGTALGTTASKVVLVLALVAGAGATGVAVHAQSRASASVGAPSTSATAKTAARVEAAPPPTTSLSAPGDDVAVVAVESLPSARLEERAASSAIPTAPTAAVARAPSATPVSDALRAKTSAVSITSAPEPVDVAKPEDASNETPAPRAGASDAVAEEAAILRSAQAALTRGDGAAALARLNEHAQRFPHGALEEERTAARVFALCASGRVTEARAAAAAFLRSSPRSPLAAQVRLACAEEGGRSH